MVGTENVMRDVRWLLASGTIFFIGFYLATLLMEWLEELRMSGEIEPRPEHRAVTDLRRYSWLSLALAAVAFALFVASLPFMWYSGLVILLWLAITVYVAMIAVEAIYFFRVRQRH
ncbi:MAG: hypothetical protein IT326_02120 [Anaerolineae bacterium]|nr:hypothetical protein [Anaerolineae bacterium]